jgi:dimethylhistidine N-methyltransferase
MQAHSKTVPSPSSFAADVRAGLSRPGRKTLPCEYLYDAIGSTLFEAISLLPEYGVTRADERIIRAHAHEIAAHVANGSSVLELGSGTGVKTRHILAALAERSHVVYYPIDISAAAMARCSNELSDVAEVRPFEGSYIDGLHHAVAQRGAGEVFLVLFLGGTIGNFERTAAEQFLKSVRAQLQSGDALILGTDLEKPVAELIQAYDDPTGVTAAFNMNLLARINRELGGNFDLREFAHEARYNPQERRVEMHLRCNTAQTIRLKDAGVNVQIEAGETIWTESSHKYALQEIRAMAYRSGFECAQQWTDNEWAFTENLLLPRREP